MATRSRNDARAAIRSRLAEQHPAITYQVADEVHTLADTDREALLDEWADNEWNAGMARLREQRDALLAASDWTQVADAPAHSVAWAKYRQALRDLPVKTDDPTAPDWPKAPEA